ncbi:MULTISPECIES: hypothetical protein [Thermotoga]|uniref:Uncharacterized protein n=1 Tax=Thermotoga neapolitana (strain ATCC 49049 / DSM 4359 / NBRC 107923 / NS-E) TaxID=309803 RepID=B9KAI9_THENN|nr:MULTISPECIES: hypothetical protein [Thermotoga]ACM23972.1 Putative uncharacterized protein [Thermotoga neapolitana DSM 4359]AJG39998.1 hypothetical protein TRQ7_00740 [Thermotoga sp. RQ7]KFZ20951.1 hypothetical protein LA10_09569 [Thermotoga neapolitana LA10]HBF10619.1 hypothetical protein [Thermotoga neapolitana]
MRVQIGGPILGTSRFRRYDLGGCSLMIGRKHTGKLPDIDFSAKSVQEIGKDLMNALDEFILERDGKVFLKLARPLTLRYSRDLTIRIDPFLTPAFLIFEDFEDGRGCVVMARTEETAEDLIKKFDETVKWPEDFPGFLKTVKKNDQVLGVVGNVGKVTGIWTRGSIVVI